MSRVNLEKGVELLAQARDHFLSHEGISPEIKRRIQGEIELIRGIEDFNDLFAMRDRHQSAHTLLTGTSDISHSQLVWTFGSPHVSFLYLRDSGTYLKLIELVEGNLQYYQDLTSGCSAGAQDLFRGEYFLETGNFNKVKYYLDRANYRASAGQQLSSKIAVNFTLARLALVEGNPQKAVETVQELTPLVERSGNHLIANSFDLCKGYLAVILGTIDKIPQWLRDGEIMVSNGFYQGLSFAHIVHGRVLLLTKDWARLEALCEDIPTKMGKYNHIFAHIHAHVLRAIAVAQLGDEQRAVSIMAQAIALAKKDNIMLSIAEYGDHVCSLLRGVMKTQDSIFLETLYKHSRKFAQKDFKQNLGLTVREQEILTLASSGASNSNIGKALCITTASVGNALSRIYIKLGVNNRMEAVKKWIDRSD